MSPRHVIFLRRRGLLALVLAVLAAAALASTWPRTDRLHVVVLHTNDVHGQVLPRTVRIREGEDPRTLGGLSRLAAYVNGVRAECAAEGAPLLVVDGGDWFQGTPEGTVDDGAGYVAALAEIGYDALCVGNHELDLGLANLRRVLASTGVPAVCANVRERGPDGPGARVDWVPSHRVVERGGLRVAIVGLLTPATPEITHADARELWFQAPVDALREVREELGDSVDWVLPVTHLGLVADQTLAGGHPDLPLVVGGHSHTYLRRGVQFEETLIVQAGSKASAVGRVDVWLDAETKLVVEIRSRLVDLDREPDDELRNARVDAIAAELVEQSDRRLARVAGQLAQPLVRSRHPLRSSNVGNLIADCLRARMKADFGIHNRGGIRCNLEAGEVTLRGLFELLPFANEVVAMTLNGAEVEVLLRQSVESEAHSGLELSGLVAVVTRDAAGHARFVRVEVDGRPIDRQRSYRLATNSFLADGGDGYAVLAAGRDRERDPVLLRDLLAERFAAEPVVEAPDENRYRVTGGDGR